MEIKILRNAHDLSIYLNYDYNLTYSIKMEYIRLLMNKNEILNSKSVKLCLNRK